MSHAKRTPIKPAASRTGGPGGVTALGASDTAGRDESPNKGRPGSPPWNPPGKRGAFSPPKQRVATAVGARRHGPVEHMHVFLDPHQNLEEIIASNGAMHFEFWLYGAYDYKLQTPHSTAQAYVCRMIDKLVTIMNKHVAQLNGRSPTRGGCAAHSSDDDHDDSPSDAPDAKRQRSSESVGKAHLIFDIISTKKHISADYMTGAPHALAQDLYAYAEKRYSETIVTSFVGLTDNTARRVGRDIYYQKSDDLAKTHLDFDQIDNERMYIIFPQKSQAPKPEDADDDPFRVPAPDRSTLQQQNAAAMAPSGTAKAKSPPRGRIA